MNLKVIQKDAETHIITAEKESELHMERERERERASIYMWGKIKAQVPQKFSRRGLKIKL